MLHSGVAQEAVSLWQRAFPDLTEAPPRPPAMLWHLSVGGLAFTLFDSPTPHAFAPTPSWSFMIDVDDAARVDSAHDVLADGGQTLMPPDSYDFAKRFTWVEDRFGISWQLRFGAAA
ncbi:MAG: VOC family protein [Pseudomonadota bacterium]